MRFEQSASYRIKVWEILTQEFFFRVDSRDVDRARFGMRLGRVHQSDRRPKKIRHGLNPASPGKLSRDVTFLGQDCSEPWQLPDSHLDVVFTSNFFEHLPSKETLQRTLAEAFRCLKPNGRLICVGPNIKFLPGEYWDFWDHFLPLTELSLQEGLELTGFSVERKWPRFLPYSMSQGFTPPLVFLRLYLRLRFIWPILGKQFLVLARRPAG